jgi:hypothetical protein
VQQLLADYAAYAKRNGVTEVPADYDVMKQAQANASQKSSDSEARVRARADPGEIAEE